MRRIVFAKSSFYRFKQYFKLTMATMIIVFFLKIFVLDFYWIPSVSMEPTLLKGDHVVGLKIVYGFLFKITPSRADVVALKLPKDPSLYIKRVVALPNETLNIKNSDLIINNKKIKKIYDTDVSKYKYIQPENVVMREFADGKDYSIIQSNVQRMQDFVAPYKNTSSSVFLLGDNRTNSIDSRNWGAVDKKRIISKVVFVWMSIEPETKKVRWDRIGLIR